MRKASGQRLGLGRCGAAFAAVLSAASAAAPAHGAGLWFEPLRRGQLATFDNESAYHIRVYVKGLFAVYEKRCPKEAPSYRVPWDLVAYSLKPAHSAWGRGGSIFSLELSARDAAFFATADPEVDVGSVAQTSCATSAHRDWMAQGEKLLGDPRLAGPLGGLSQACEAVGQSNVDCTCFGEAFDMQSSPAQRRRFLDARTPLEGFQQTLHDPDFATRVALRCPSTPNFFAAVIVAQPPPHADQPDDAVRLREGQYDIKPAHDPYRRVHGSYLVRRADNWRYEFKFQGVGGNHVGWLSSDGKSLTLYVGTPRPRTFQVMDDGTLRTLDGDNRFDLVHASARPQPPGTQRMPVPTPGKTKADPRQCARLEVDIERARADPRRANALSILEKRYADWCAGG